MQPQKNYLIANLLLTFSLIFAVFSAHANSRAYIPNGHPLIYYVKAGAGYTTASGLAAPATTQSLDRSELGARIAVGVIKRVSRDFAVGAEAGWGTYGKAKYISQLTGDTLEMKFRGFDFSGVVYYYLSPQFSLFGKLGLGLIENKATTFFNAQNLTATHTFTDTGLLAGLGGNVQVAPNVSVGAEYFHITGSQLTASTSFVQDEVPAINAMLAYVSFNFA